MPVQVVPGFTYRQLGINYSLQNWTNTGSMGLVLHVAIGGDTSLFPWFSNPQAKASSHWWAGKSGGREQYLDPFNHRSWAQAAGNDEFHSVETSGNPDEALSVKQIEAVAAIYAQGARWFGWPFRLAEYPSQRGLGWHGMGGSAWGGHTGCPGDLRKAQRPDILRAAEAIFNGGGSGGLPGGEDDMPLSDEDVQRVANAVWERQLKVWDFAAQPALGIEGRTASSEPAGSLLGRIERAGEMEFRKDPLAPLVARWPVPGGADPGSEPLRSLLARIERAGEMTYQQAVAIASVSGVDEAELAAALAPIIRQAVLDSGQPDAVADAVVGKFGERLTSVVDR